MNEDIRTSKRTLKRIGISQEHCERLYLPPKTPLVLRRGLESLVIQDVTVGGLVGVMSRSYCTGERMGSPLHLP
jgi:hypothetical protein